MSIEKQINIIDQEFSNASASASPDNNSLGVINWDADQYSNATIFFEAVIKCDTCSGGNSQATAALYTAGSMTKVTSSDVTRSASSYQPVRSSAISANLIDGLDYSVRLVRDANAGTAYIKAARLVIIQNNDKLTKTETQIEIGNNTTSTNTAYEVMPAPKLALYESRVYSPLPSVYFEASLQTSDSGGTAYAGLTASATCASFVSGGEISTQSTDWVRVRSNALTLNNDTTYFVCIKSSEGHTARIANAKLIYQQSDGYSITRTQSYLPMINTYASETANSYTNASFPMTIKKTNFSGSDATFAYFFDTTMRTSADTGYARLYNTSDSAIISNSEKDTTNPAYSHFRSGNIEEDLPAQEKTIDTQLMNSNAGTTAVSVSQLVVNMVIPPELNFIFEAVPTSTNTNGITTSANSEVNKLDFGYLIAGNPKYLAHKLTASTTAGDGYTVGVKMTMTMQGNYPANVIEEFPASWSSPTTWTEPTGTEANVNTGWIGANTSDTRVPGWSSGSGLFGSIGSTSRTVMKSSGTDSGTSIYVTYAMEVNDKQPTDLYVGTLEYNVLPTY